MREVTGNRWWVSFKFRIRDFTIKYSKQLNLDRVKKTKSLENRLSWAVDGGDSQAVELAKGDPECKASKCCKGFVVRSRLERVPNEAMNCNAFVRKEEFQRFLCRYNEFIKSLDGYVLQSGC